MNPSEVWLRDLYDDTLHFPEDELFTFSGDVAPYAIMVVEGPPATPLSLEQRLSTSRVATVVLVIMLLSCSCIVLFNMLF